MRRLTHSPDDRGQAHTVEAFVAALLLISGLLFAMQATAVTPLSASTSNQQIENQQRALADDLLSTAAEDGSLKAAVLHWNTTTGEFQASGEETFYQRFGSQNAFLASLNDTLAERRIAYNVRVRYHLPTSDGGVTTDNMVITGQSSNNAVTATRTITLYDDDRLTGETGCELRACSFYASDVDTDSRLYNRVEVRITTWRM